MTLLDGEKLLRKLNSTHRALSVEARKNIGTPQGDRQDSALKMLSTIINVLPDFEIHLSGQSPHNVRNTDPEDAHDAAGSNTFGRSKNRERVYLALRELGSGTPEEIANKAMEMFPGHYPPYSLARRVTDLHERGLIRKTGEKRQTVAGGTADVWELIPQT